MYLKVISLNLLLSRAFSNIQFRNIYIYIYIYIYICVCVSVCVLAVYNKAQAQRISRSNCLFYISDCFVVVVVVVVVLAMGGLHPKQNR